VSEQLSKKTRETAFHIEHATRLFLKDRMNDRSAFEWALQLRPDQLPEREAVRSLLIMATNKVEEPYRTAWHWLLESWKSDPNIHRQSQHSITHWIKRAGISGELIRLLVDIVRPYVKADKRSEWRLDKKKPKRRKPKRWQDLAYVTVSSGKTVSLSEVGLQSSTDFNILSELFDRLEAALLDGLHVARRLGWMAERDMTTSYVHRVYQVSTADGNHDSDEYREGFAPVVKLLYEVTSSLASEYSDFVRQRISGWRASEFALTRRLWAAAARNPKLASDQEVSAFLLSAKDEEYWSITRYPEMAELRARRFGEFAAAQKAAIEDRILRLPPASMWARRVSKDDRRKYQHHIAVTELRRIIAGGGTLSAKAQAWLDDMAPKLDDPLVVDRVDAGFLERASARWVGDEALPFQVSSLTPDKLLEDLESSLVDDPWSRRNKGAETYITENWSSVLYALESFPKVSARCPRIWQRIGYINRPAVGADSAKQPEEIRKARDVLRVILKVPDSTIGAAVVGLADWVSNWARHLKRDQAFSALWLRLWPYAVTQTNANETQDTDFPTDEAETKKQRIAKSRLADEALNTTVGRLMSAFLDLCPNLKDVPKPFAGGQLRKMRDAAIKSEGNSRLQMLHRFMTSLEYMRNADQVWADRHLLRPLRESRPEEEEIWDAIARNPVLKPKTMRTIGKRMVEVVHSSRLPDETRAHLAERVVIRVLWDRMNGKVPSVKETEVQQMLRLCTDLTRAACGHILGNFVQRIKDDRKSPEIRFRNVVKPFLNEVWPKERSLCSRSLSDALANLPVKCEGAFADAVDTIERLLAPFDCWSLWEYDLYKGDVNEKEIRRIGGKKEAAALLKLLDLTIGSEEGAVVPTDLDKALAAIQQADANLIRDVRFARLLSLVRQ
jgi:hypothetical protein